MKKICITVLIMLLLSSCSRTAKIGRMKMALAFGVSHKDGGCVLQILIDEYDKEGGKYSVIEEEGSTVSSALESILAKYNNEIYLKQVKLLLIEKELAATMPLEMRHFFSLAAPKYSLRAAAAAVKDPGEYLKRISEKENAEDYFIMLKKLNLPLLAELSPEINLIPVLSDNEEITPEIGSAICVMQGRTEEITDKKIIDGIFTVSGRSKRITLDGKLEIFEINVLKMYKDGCINIVVSAKAASGEDAERCEKILLESCQSAINYCVERNADLVRILYTTSASNAQNKFDMSVPIKLECTVKKA